MRGSRPEYGLSHPLEGIIPAGAGLTIPHFQPKNLQRDHPRGCGAHNLPTRLKRAKKGSSPRVRGSLGYKSITGIKPGIIPAGAGLTSSKRRCSRRRRDHPRGCGAHFMSLWNQITAAGPSPRVRGSLPVDANKYKVQGIIPAGAGLTPFRMRGAASARDHPRGCGAHVDDFLLFSSDLGSSPRVRGSPTSTLKNAIETGIIPAGAGLTSASPRRSSSSGDHPRGCGAHLLRHQRSISLLGSSPRVRGSLFHFLGICHDLGIIPAGAGLTLFLV